jgi:3',5'-cyclic AMP phosphodiesterase CpdA
MIIAQLTDTHILAPSEDGKTWQYRARDLANCVSDINNMQPQPDVVVHTGDMSNFGRPAEYMVACEILGRLEMPLYAVPGNRDAGADFWDYFLPEGARMAGGSTQFMVKNHAIRLIGVDTRHPSLPQGHMSPDRLNELDAMLWRTRGIKTLVFMHHTPFEIATLPDPLQFASRGAANALVNMLKDHNHVVRILCGHCHRHGETMIGNALATTMPSVASDLRKGGFPDNMRNATCYQVHDMTDASTVSWTRIVRHGSAGATTVPQGENSGVIMQNAA